MDKVCTKAGCVFEGRPQPASQFYLDKSRRDGLTIYCKVCSKRQRPPQPVGPSVYELILDILAPNLVNADTGNPIRGMEVKQLAKELKRQLPALKAFYARLETDIETDIETDSIESELE